MKLSTRILTASLLPFIVTILAYYLLTSFTFSKYLEGLYLSEAESKLIKIEQNFREFIIHTERHLKFFATLQPPDEQNLQRTRVNISQLIQTFEPLFQVSAINSKGREWLRVEKFPSSDSSSELKSFFSSPVYLQPMLNLVTYTGKIEYVSKFSTPFMDFSIPVNLRKTGAISGVIWAKVSLQEMQYVLEQNIPEHGKIILIDGQTGTNILQADATDIEYTRLEQQTIQNVIKSDTFRGVVKNDINDLSATFVYRKFTANNIDYLLLYYQPDNHIYYLANQLDRNTQILLFAGLLIFLFTSFLLIKRIIHPLTRVTQYLSRLEKQYQPTNKKLLHENKSIEKDEITLLQNTFNSFQNQLHTYKTEIEKFNQTLENRVKERTQELKTTQQMLRHSEKLSAIGKLSASIAHEINNPLYGIQSIIEGIKLDTDLNEENLEMANLALEECARVKNLIGDLQSFNRPSSGEKQTTDIHRIINAILIISKKRLKDKGITVIRDFSADLPQISLVRDQIKQVVLNIFNNAQDSFEERNGTISIKTEQQDRNIAIHIKDDGCGINFEHLNQIFEPFFTTKPEVKGTGLGLSVSYGIVKSHGGEIKVETKPGSGSTFSIILPIV